MMSSEWMPIDDYASLTGLEEAAIHQLVERGKLTARVENGRMYIDAAKGAMSVVPSEVQRLSATQQEIMVGPQFVEKTIGTIINLHEKVLGAKDETIESVRNENLFLKEALASLQELYDEDRKTIETLTDQLKYSQREVEFMRRKYKLMWGKVVDEYSEK